MSPPLWLSAGWSTRIRMFSTEPRAVAVLFANEEILDSSFCCGVPAFRRIVYDKNTRESVGKLGWNAIPSNPISPPSVTVTLP